MRGDHICRSPSRILSEQTGGTAVNLTDVDTCSAMERKVLPTAAPTALCRRGTLASHATGKAPRVALGQLHDAFLTFPPRALIIESPSSIR